MIYINHEKKAIFIHIPKTGGTYIGPTLVKYYGFKSYLELITKRRPDHNIICKINYSKRVLTGNHLYDYSFFNKVMGLVEYCKTSKYLLNKMDMDEDKWNSYTKFCFIRNPYDRALSGWRHFNIVFKRNIEFYDYLSQPNIMENTTDIEYGHIFMSQKKQIQNIEGTCGVDIIGRFEYLEDDFRFILNKLGFKHIIHITKKENVSNKDGSDNILLEPRSVDVLNKLFRDDFECFHYLIIDPYK
jgi:hypothetical protein